MVYSLYQVDNEYTSILLEMEVLKSEGEEVPQYLESPPRRLLRAKYGPYKGVKRKLRGR